MITIQDELRAIGYLALIEMFHIESLPHYRCSYVAKRGQRRTSKENAHEVHVYPKGYSLKDENDPMQHLEFALKHEGVNLLLLKAIFHYLDARQIEAFVKAQPTGKHARTIWYLYETLNQVVLNLPPVKRGSYFNVLDPKKYYTCTSIPSPRHRINDNFLGHPSFCPIVRRTDLLNSFEKKNLPRIAMEMVREYDPLVIGRAMRFLYTKETMSSYEIERELPDKKRVARFVELLKEAENLKSLNKEKLIQLQNVTVDPRFADSDYRITQNYVGELPNLYSQKLHYISPKPHDVRAMMEGLLFSLERMLKSGVHPVVTAAAVSFGFVFIHPFEDGNGRLHRFFIHHILSKSGFTPEGVIFPVSAVMLKNRRRYDEILESVSEPLMKLITDYELDEEGELTVTGETAEFYQYPDYTVMAEYLFSCVEETIETDFKKELEYIANYDRIKEGIQNVVDMPDKKIDLFIKMTMQNEGSLSPKKRKTHFSMLEEEEIDQLENLVKEVL
ncbi:MAG: hypothetical protein ACI9S8_000452 [Chlamydiales bacterium]|jgi:hypothetical protein